MSCCHDHVCRVPSSALTQSSHSSWSTGGVGPADSTGKSPVRYCPGGSRSSRPRGRPWNPRVTKSMPSHCTAPDRAGRHTPAVSRGPARRRAARSRAGCASPGAPGPPRRVWSTVLRRDVEVRGPSSAAGGQGSSSRCATLHRHRVFGRGPRRRRLAGSERHQPAHEMRHIIASGMPCPSMTASASSSAAAHGPVGSAGAPASRSALVAHGDVALTVIGIDRSSTPSASRKRRCSMSMADRLEYAVVPTSSNERSRATAACMSSRPPGSSVPRSSSLASSMMSQRSRRRRPRAGGPHRAHLPMFRRPGGRPPYVLTVTSPDRPPGRQDEPVTTMLPKLSVSGGVATVRLARPDAGNAVTCRPPSRCAMRSEGSRMPSTRSTSSCSARAAALLRRRRRPRHGRRAGPPPPSSPSWPRAARRAGHAARPARSRPRRRRPGRCGRCRRGARPRGRTWCWPPTTRRSSRPTPPSGCRPTAASARCCCRRRSVPAGCALPADRHARRRRDRARLGARHRGVPRRDARRARRGGRRRDRRAAAPGRGRGGAAAAPVGRASYADQLADEAATIARLSSTAEAGALLASIRPSPRPPDPRRHPMSPPPRAPSTTSSAAARAGTPDRVALVFDDRTWTYAALDDAVSRAAAHLLGLGLTRCDRVATVGVNSDAYLLAFPRVRESGLVHVPINYALTGPRADLPPRRLGGRVPSSTWHLRESVEAVRADTRPRAGAAPPRRRRRAPATVERGRRAVLDLETRGHRPRLQLLYTSGTTSQPKGAMMTHRALVHEYTSRASSRSTCARTTRRCTRCRSTHSAQMHVFLLPYLAVGATNHLLTTARRRDDPRARRETHRIGSLFLAPTVWVPLSNHRHSTRPTSRRCTRRTTARRSCRSRCVNRRLQQRLPELGFWNMLRPVRDRPAGHGPAPRGARRAAEACGRDGALRRGPRRRPGGLRRPGREPGELLYRSPQLCTGYWNKQDATSEAFRDGWFHSGDLVTRDAAGYLTVVDRIKDVINTGGVMVASREVEDALYATPPSARFAVIATPHERWVEAVTAVVVLRAGRP